MAIGKRFVIGIAIEALLLIYVYISGGDYLVFPSGIDNDVNRWRPAFIVETVCSYAETRKHASICIALYHLRDDIERLQINALT